MDAKSPKTATPTVSTSVASSDVTTSIATAAAESPPDTLAPLPTAGESSLELVDSDEVLSGGSASSFGRSVEANTGGVSNPASPSATHGKRIRRPPRSELILFLCPNGHKLHGLKTLAGKVGKCPHCGAKFEIPFPNFDDDWQLELDQLDDTDTEDPLNDYRGGSADSFGEQDMASLNELGGIQASPELDRLVEEARADTGSSVLSRITEGSNKPNKSNTTASPLRPPPLPAAPVGRGPAAAGMHALAELVRRLWVEREHGGIIELHLSSGAMLVPDWFDQKLSRGTHGLFGAQAADGTVTLTVVPWDEVTRVVVRGVVGLPEGIFE